MLRAQGITLEIAGRTLCANLNVAFSPGENWVILGANGSGKTTLLHALAGLRAPDSGRVSLDGRDIGTIQPRRRARRLGVLLQEAESEFPATVMETVMTGRHPHLERWQWEGAQDYQAAEAALATVGLGELAHRSLSTLSGGERRRVEIAALLAQDAPVCLLDEPTNHLDLRHQTEVLDRLAARARRPGHLNVFVLHDVNLAARVGTHALLLFDHGECRHGPLAEMLNLPHLERLYGCRLRAVRDGGDTWFLPA